jgi:RimJ/RimL family protein N-acetyltransferase
MQLKPFNAGYWRDWLLLHGDPRVMKHALDSPLTTPHHIGPVLKHFERFADANPGLGIWRAHESGREDSFLGSFSLMPLAGTDDVEIGCLLRPEAWGGQYALEGASALLEHAFTTLQLPAIVGLSHPMNRPVQFCLRRLHFRLTGTEHHYDHDVLVFRLERNRFAGPSLMAARAALAANRPSTAEQSFQNRANLAGPAYELIGQALDDAGQHQDHDQRA